MMDTFSQFGYLLPQSGPGTVLAGGSVVCLRVKPHVRRSRCVAWFRKENLRCLRCCVESTRRAPRLEPR